MPKKRSEKQQEIDQLNQELQRVSSVVLSTFQALTGQQDTELRRAIQSVGGRYRVLKNTLAKRAAQGTPAESLLGQLKGINSIAYTAGDPVALAKALTKYAKDNPTFTFRAGVVEGRVVSLEQLQALATLPTRNELYSRVLFLIQASAQRLARALAGSGRRLAVVLQQAVKEKKFSEASLPTPAS